MSELKQCFATPVLYDKIKDKQLLDNAVSFILSSFEGSREFQHDKRILENKELKEFKEKEVIPAFQKYLDLTGIKKSLQNSRLIDSTNYSSWSSVNKNYTMRPHNHDNAQLSAVFYLMCEEQDKGGAIVMYDPRTNANRGFDDDFIDWFRPITHIPKTGDIIIFPSYLFHSVDVFTGNMRMCLPVDVIFQNTDYDKTDNKDY
jgi:hypothetical protein